MTNPNHNLMEQHVKALIRELRGMWPFSELPYELFHYTDAKGLLGILTTKQFWATDIYFLNDSMELQYAFDLINSILEGQTDDLEDKSVKGFLENSKVILNINSGMKAYVTCFCENGNLLSQWRAYGSRGSGYSIGVAAQSLKETERDTAGILMFETRLRKVIYDKSTQEALIRETLDRFCKLFARTIRTLDEEASSVADEFSNFLAGELSEYLYFFKSPVFEDEKEWRVINVFSYYQSIFDDELSGRDNRAPEFRVSGGNLVPYIALDFAAPPDPSLPLRRYPVLRGYPITSVTFGPSLHPKLTERSLYELLNSTLGNGNSVNVNGSAIPLRTTIS
jgi:hypothetical protein